MAHFPYSLSSIPLFRPLDIFRVHREERWLVLGSLLFFTTLNVLFLQQHWASYTKGVKGGFWALLYKNFSMSGYDCWSWLTISGMRIHFETNRHPLYLTFLYPLHQLNHWLIAEYHVNFATLFMAATLIFSGVYSVLFLYRILRELIGLERSQSLLLVQLLFSFGHVAIPFMVPDHFGISMMLLLMTAYIVGWRMQQGRPLHTWQTAVLLFFTTGMAVSNGVKTLLASFFARGRQFFTAHHLIMGILVPLLALFAIQRYQYYAFEVPQKTTIAKIEAKNEQKMTAQAKEARESHNQWVKDHDMKRAAHSGLLQLMDFDTPRGPVLIENYLGEATLLHADYALHDVYVDRPPIVRYRSWWCYGVVAIIGGLFVAGLYAGRRQRLLKLMVTWWLFDFFLNMVLGFGVNEVYIMTSGWAFIIPTAIGFLLSGLPLKRALCVEGIVLIVTLTLWINNYLLIMNHCR